VPALPAVVTSLNSREILASGQLFDLFEEKKRERATPRAPPLDIPGKRDLCFQ